jgi:hypothetical protein
MKELVFVHGRAQEHKDAAELKQIWVEAWRRGLAKSGLDLPLPQDKIRFPYYGQTLYDLAAHLPEGEAAKVVVKGVGAGAGEDLHFLATVLQEVQRVHGLSDAQVQAMTQTAYVEKGPLQWEWVQGILAAIDRYIPGASSASIALATNDVYQYLRNPGLATVIDNGVRQAFDEVPDKVVVSHSLGTVVAYNLLRREGEAHKWKVPLFVTLGSPLAVSAIRAALRPISSPGCVGHWFNAMDSQDVVALYPLDEHYFKVDPLIENKIDVHNATPNHHGIVSYLDDAQVAKRIYDALAQ